ncbi:lecithin retinol acyltransferase family protein [Acinetobacter sp. VNK23]|uniref:lecithin retinol acyltransferase family protein n=1 Tax=Acinetobacter thutiue TaxID=2998078 RepID=UPI002578EF82|nr:lecithin retinol acyltransferase family protein [Acinetobacter thutiue]MDM1022292.1 lecithin retinol acyltransferase family protein [Acinetobacter thutiue]
MQNLHPGSHLSVSRGVYEHHGIYIGNNQVIHYSGFAEAFNKGCIEQTTLENFLDGRDQFTVVNYPSNEVLYTNQQVVERAYRCLGEDNYNLIFNNCEHFACWCVTGEKRSEQVRTVMRQSSTAVLSYYTLRKYGLLTTTSAPIATTVMTSTGTSVLTHAATGGAIGASTAAIALGTGVTTSATVGVLGATALGVTSVAAAPVVITAGIGVAVIGGLFSLFSD